MKITEENLPEFLKAMKRRLEAEIKEGATVEVVFKAHYPDPPFIEIDGQVFPYPAVGETVSISIGICGNKT